MPDQKGATPLARVFGIEVRLHFSVLLIFTLIVVSLATGLLPGWHPEWTAWMRWSAAIIAAVLFLISLLIHEMSHALTARSRGIGTRSITLFLFGGVAEIEKDAQRPQDEFLIAIAGPLASLAIAVICTALTVAVAPPEAFAGETIAFAELSVVTTIALWLAAVNFMLAAFNLIPGFPLDGGRVFRALLWWRSGDMVRATEQAASVGSAFGWLLMAWGTYRALLGDLAGGLWLVFIGWFLQRLAKASASQLLMERALNGFEVADVMRTRFERVPAELRVDEFVNDYLLRSAQVLWPVSENDQDVGFMTAEQLGNGTGLTLAEVMTPLAGAEAETLTADLSATEALRRLSDRLSPLPVVRNGRIVGIVHQADILRWMSLHTRYG